MKAEAKTLYFLGEWKRLTIPFFQRRYVWKEENWEEFLEGFQNRQTVPFLGSLILKEDGGSNYCIIDGQQRLTTITVLAKAIYDCMSDACKNPSSGIRNTIESLLFYRQNAADDFEDSLVRIKHSRLDFQAYEQVIKAGLQNATMIDLDTINEQSSSILKCYKFYRMKFNGSSDAELKILFNAVFDREHPIFVIIELEKDDINEQSIFDTINRAGVRLSTADIIKNNLFKRMLAVCEDDKDKSKVVRVYEEYWEKTFSKDFATTKMWDEERVFGNVKHSNLEFLLYSVACIKWGEDRDMFADLAAVFEREILNMNYAEIFQVVEEIKEYADIFKKYILEFKADLDDEQKNVYIKYDDHVNRLLLILQKCKVQMFYPYVLKRLYDVKGDEADKKLVSDFQKLESFVVRRKISTRGTHDYTSKCYQIIKNGIDFLVESDFTNPTGKISNGEVKTYLANTKDDVAKLILFCVELYRRKTHNCDVLALEYNFTLEHIMPKKWQAEWSNIPVKKGSESISAKSTEGEQIRNRAIQSLGNKTLLTHSLNSSVKNASFKSKIEGLGPNKPGYREHTTLFITRELVEKAGKRTKWDEGQIEKRLEELYKEFLKIWPSYEAPKKDPIPPKPEIDDPEMSNYTEEQLNDPLQLLSAITTEEEMLAENELPAFFNVQKETISRYLRQGKILPDKIVPRDRGGDLHYFEKKNLQMYAAKFGWTVIDDSNRKEIFETMICEKTMSYSYKPVLIKAIFENANKDGRVRIGTVISYFIDFYAKRRKDGKFVEVSDSVFAKENCTYEEARKTILRYPYDRFASKKMLYLDEERAEISVNKKIWRELDKKDITRLLTCCENNLEYYYSER